MKELSISATTDNIQAVTDFVNLILEDNGCGIKEKIQIDIAIDELFGNIAQYAYAPDTGTATVRVEVTENPKMAHITFIDTGIPYNPLAKADPPVNLSAEERKIGGLGIYMVKNSMDKMEYEYKDGQNILTISKNI